MATTHFSGPVESDNGFVGSVTGGITGDVTGNLTGNVTGAVLASTPVNATAATLAVAQATHGGRVVTLNRAAGIAVTLPAATGSGAFYRFFIGTTVTSNTTTIKVTGNDTMSGLALMAQDAADTVVGWETAADTDTITFDGSTTGGILGDFVELHDVATDKWYVRVTGSSTGTEATPFSATV